ncbi:MAG: lipopolysaccharide heptosyltransferase II [Gammaproteobacteria bacterium]|nr:lipopolysaccharide heptosyltransferase II [Gammaproteobacteria bacterium]MDH5659724.1 lipopolysaccharide heptosyltransferase II [Gammaproteobacteria bacterium]
MPNAQQILVAGPAWVGDMVMAQSLFITLKQRTHPVEIDVLAPAWSTPILARMPEVRDTINLPIGHGEFGLWQRYLLGKSLRTKYYDQAIITPRSYKAALVPFFAKAKQRTGYRGEMRYGVINDIHTLDKNILQQTVQRYVALGLNSNIKQAPAIPFPKLTVDSNNLQKLLVKLNLNIDKPVVALLPGAEYGEAKRWPVEHFSTLASLLCEQGLQVWILGSDKDYETADTLAKGNDAINLCGKIKLEDSIDLLSVCKSAVSNDSGLMHIAAAVGIPLIAIYGSSTPNYTPPLTNNAKIQYLDLKCSPCFERICPLGHTNCLRGILPKLVFKSVLENIRE